MTTRDYGDIQGELTAKVLDTLDAWVLRHGKGLVSDRELFILADGLYDTVQGLIPWDAANVIYQVRNDTKARLSARRSS